MIAQPYSSRVVILGAHGQLGQAFNALLTPAQCVAALARDAFDLAALDTLADRTHQLIERYQPSVLINAAAYTAVDRAQDEEAKAYDINALAPGVLAAVAASHGVPLVHYSTDYVFDGRGDEPYSEAHVPSPLSVYGRSKLAGERAVQAAAGPHLILRTSWVFGVHGQNFLKTMLKLACERDSLAVVNDQFGAPTPAALLARLTLQMLGQLHDKKDERWGLYHLCPTGYTSWHGYASFAIAHARALGWPVRVQDTAIAGIASADYPVKAPRPLNSRLTTAKLRDAFGLELPHWQSGVKDVVAQLERA